jgi:hypothetical protein
MLWLNSFRWNHKSAPWSFYVREIRVKEAHMLCQEFVSLLSSLSSISCLVFLLSKPLQGCRSSFLMSKWHFTAFLWLSRGPGTSLVPDYGFRGVQLLIYFTKCLFWHSLWMCRIAATTSSSSPALCFPGGRQTVSQPAVWPLGKRILSYLKISFPPTM